MARWEYLYAEASGGAEFLVGTESKTGHPSNIGLPIPQYLNERGEQGWELVSVYALNASQVRLILKRPVLEG